MESGAIYRILLVAGALVAVAAEPSIKIEIDDALVQPGSAFEFQCVAVDLVGGTSFLRIKKTVQKPDGTSSVLDLATNTLLSKISEQIGRYHVKYEVEEGSKKLKFFFSVTDAQLEDSGEYSCVIMGGNGIIAEDTKEITVINTMDFVVSMTVTRANHPDEEPLVFSSSSDEVHEYELEEHEPFHINVQTSETNPPAKLDMTVGDVNINDQFNILVHPVQFGDDSSSLIGIKYTVTAEGVINVDHSYRSGFQVVARVADEQASVGFKVKFSGYPPEIDSHCTHSIMAGRYQENVNFVCTILSAEPVEAYFYYFRPLEDGQEQQIIMPNDQDPLADYHYNVFLYEDRENGQYNITLHMPQIFPQMFTKYTLYASNSKGTAKHTFTLEEDTSKSVIALSKSSEFCITMSTLFVLFMATVILQQP